MKEQNEYYLGYNVLNLFFESDNLDTGIRKACNFINNYFSAATTVIYKYDNNKYSSFISDKSWLVEDALSFLNTYVGKMNNSCKFIPLNDINLSNIMLVPFSIKKDEYVLAIVNSYDFNNVKNDMLLLQKVFKVIMDKYNLFNKLEKNSLIDGLTGLENRVAYNEKLEEINSNNNKYFYVLFDLFRLKYVNDNYSHAKGDEYILKAVNILKKYFPKYQHQNNIEKLVSNLYRIGGDEFVLINNTETFNSLDQKLSFASNEASNINLGINDPNLFLGINYGIAFRDSFEDVEDLYLEADKKLSLHKKETYINLGINRRK